MHVNTFTRGQSESFCSCISSLLAGHFMMRWLLSLYVGVVFELRRIKRYITLIVPMLLCTKQRLI